MAQVESLCRLCVKSSRNSRSLYDKNGCCNEMYDITVKYFDPEILNVRRERQISVMCLECWRQVSDFHYFKESVLLAQEKLIEVTKKAEAVAECHNENTIDTCNEPASSNVVYYDIFVVERKAQPPLEIVIKPEIVDDDLPTAEQQNKANVLTTSADTFTDGYFNNEQEEMDLSSLSDLESIDGQFSSDDEEISLPTFFVKRSKTEDESTIISHIPETTAQVEESDTSKSQDKQKEKRRRKNGAQLDAIIAKWRSSLECQYCNEKFPYFTFLQQHCRHKHPGKVCYVECCHYKFLRRSEIAEHAILHGNPNTFKCEKCGKICNARGALLYHIRHKHGGKSELTNSRNKYGPSTERLDSLIAQWKESLECGVCSEPFPKYRLLQTHFRHYHPDQECHIVCCEQKWDLPFLIEDHIQLHLNPEPYECKICGQTFTLRRALDLHTTTQHQILLEENLGYTNQENDGDDEGGVPEKCVKKINRRKSAFQLDAAIAEWKPKLDCDICFESCATFTMLSQHFHEKHPGVVCYITCCNIKITRRFQVEQHARFHMDRDAFRCKVCGKALRGRSNLKKHMYMVHDIQARSH